MLNYSRLDEAALASPVLYSLVRWLCICFCFASFDTFSRPADGSTTCEALLLISVRFVCIVGYADLISWWSGRRWVEMGSIPAGLGELFLFLMLMSLVLVCNGRVLSAK